MTLPRVGIAIGLFALGAYVADVVFRPAQVAREARRYAQSVGKPVLNVGAGTPGSSLRVAILGATIWGDVNCDIAASKSTACGNESFCWCDAVRLPFPDKTFGAVIASHVLEHMADPEAAVAEWERVADRVYIVVPAWWAPHTWLHPGHCWVFWEDGSKTPLWSCDRHGQESGR